MEKRKMAKSNNVENEVAVVETAAVTTVVENAPLVATSQEDMVIPFLKLIQQQADELIQGKEKYNPAVKAGDLYDSVTRQVYTGADIIICGVQKYFGEWTPEARGKLIAKHRPTSETVVKAIKTECTADSGSKYFKLSTPAGNDLIETFGVLALVKTNGIALPVMFTLSKTGFMAGKTLQTMLMLYQQQGIPVFTFSTVITSNSKGSWFKPVFQFKEMETDDNIKAMAVGMSKVAADIIFKAHNNEDGSESAVDTNDLGV